MTQRTRAIIITGPFYDWEIELFAKLMRHMEQSRTNETFSLVVNDPGLTFSVSDEVGGQGVAEAIELVERIFPKPDGALQ